MHFSTQARSCCLMASSSFPMRQVCCFTTSTLVSGVTEATWEFSPKRLQTYIMLDHLLPFSLLRVLHSSQHTVVLRPKRLKKIPKHLLSVSVLLITASNRLLVLTSLVPPDCRTELYVVSDTIPHALDTGSIYRVTDSPD